MILALVALSALAAPAGAGTARLEQLVEANVLGTHAFQVALAMKAGKGDPACYSPSPTDAQLAKLETHQAALLKADVKEVRAWAEGKPSDFDPSRPRAAPRLGDRPLRHAAGDIACSPGG